MGGGRIGGSPKVAGRVVRAAGAVGATAALGAVLAIWARDVGLDSMAFSLAANVAVMAWTVLLHRLLRPTLTGRWFRPAAWEQGGRIWRAAGVDAYGRILRRSGWERHVRRMPLGLRGEELRRYEEASRAAEWAHLLGFGVVCALALGVAVGGHVRGAALLVGVGVVLHLYPALLQRRVRPRVQRVLAWRERRPRR